MLGCNDFCGYYEWTFHYLRRRFGNEALKKYWEEAIAADSQQHYAAAAREKGLRGLNEAWSKTGVDEHCNWSVTLQEDRNLLRLDMRECPSKGFLLDNNLNADEDYCDHCIGWIAPALHQAGFQVAGHEHNHCGQCWWEIRAANANQPPVEVACDIRQDPRWLHGYLHRFEHNEKLLLHPEAGDSDSCEVLNAWFHAAERIAVVDPTTSVETPRPDDTNVAVIVSGESYAAAGDRLEQINGVLLSHNTDVLAGVARRYLSSKKRPLLMHTYLPLRPCLNFAAHGLPRAVPILPLLIRAGVYTHDTATSPPDVHTFAALLAAALHKRVLRQGVEPETIDCFAAPITQCERKRK